MKIEFPQAEQFCYCLDLRIGACIIILIRVVILVLILAAISLGHTTKTELVLLVLTFGLFFLFLIAMIPAVIWEPLSYILMGAILEIFIFFWLFFMCNFYISLAIVRGAPSLMLLGATILMVLELYVLWIMWSYYVDVKADYQGYRNSITSTSTAGSREGSRRISI